MKGNLEPIFRPATIAVVGASTNPGKMGYQILDNIIQGGYGGKIFPLNPKAEEILGLSCVNDPGDLPEGVDLAVMIIPAGAVPASLDRLGERGLKSAIVITGGFSEAGEEGEKLQAQLAEVSARRGIRVIGPNCQGVNYPYHSMCASWPLIKMKGDMAIISQSGTVGAALIDWASEERIGFSAFVSLGNRADVDESELIEYFSNDESTRVITLYIEGVKDPARFKRALGGTDKPVVIFKAGRTEGGRRAAESHTKSLAGRDEIYGALFKKYGVTRANSLEELYDLSKAHAYLPRPDGNRMLIVTSSGGSAIIATDTAEEEGFEVTPLRKSTADELLEVLPGHCIISNPLDLTGDTDAERYRKVLEIAGKEFDIVMPIFGDPIPGAVDVVSGRSCQLVTYLGGADVEREERKSMGKKKIAVFPTPERAVKAASVLIPRRLERKAEEADHDTKEEESKGSMLPPVDAFSLLERYGIPVSPYFKVNNLQDVDRYAESLGYPVVLKVNSPEVVHKTDVGGVILDLSTKAETASAYRELMEVVAFLGVRTDGLLLAKQMPKGREMIMGVTRDEQFGHAMAVGLGGIFVEVLKDVSFRLLPVNSADMEEMLRELRGRSILSGVRGEGQSDLGSLGILAEKVSRLVKENPSIVELDLNPLFLYQEGLCVADVRIILEG